jgi:hypothetical protein
MAPGMDAWPVTRYADANYFVGAPLARTEAEVVLRGMLRRFHNLALDGEPATLR